MIIGYSMHHHQCRTGYNNQWEIGLAREEKQLEAQSLINSADILAKVVINRPVIEESPVFVSENKIKMDLNDMKKDIFYPVEYKNKKYMIGTPKEGIIDIYKVK